MAPVHQVLSKSARRFGLWSVALQTDRQTEKPDNKGYLEQIPIKERIKLKTMWQKLFAAVEYVFGKGKAFPRYRNSAAND